MKKDELEELVEYDEDRDYYWNQLPTDEPLNDSSVHSRSGNGKHEPFNHAG